MQENVTPYFAAANRWNPRIEALVDWDESAAAARAGRVKPGVLSGWPVAVKDIIDVEGLPTRCNADFLSAPPAARNAGIVDALLANGGFVAAKAVTTSFAYLDSGPTRNPWNPAHTPGGSSSGSAAAVACGMVRLALGTQTVGSVNRPASFCGVAGFKPTFGRLSTDGVFPFSPTVDTVGIFGASTFDIQTAFAAVTGEPAVSAPDVLRVGVAADLLCEPADAEMQAAVQQASDRLAFAAHDVRPATLPATVARAYGDHATLIAAEAAASHVGLFERHSASYPPKLRDLVLRGRGIGDAEFKAADAHRQGTAAVIDRLLSQFDLLLTPSAPGPAPKGLDSTGDPRMNLLWTHSGVPTLTLPAALSRDGLPLGVQLVGRRMKDQALLAAGICIESALGFSERLPG